MPLKPCLKSSKTSPHEDTSIVATSHPPIPEPIAQLPRTSSYIDYSALPYSQVYVHFPPSPTLTSTHVVDPPRLYDRSPIVVAENSCAMPQRGCPGRTYATIDGVGRGVIPANNSLALSCPKFSIVPPNPSTVPALVVDEHGSGSSSDDSDATAPFPDSNEETVRLCRALCSPGHHAPMCRMAPHFRHIPRETDASTQFLPYPPVSPRSSKSSSVIPRKTPSSVARPSPSFTSNWDSSSCLEGF